MSYSDIVSLNIGFVWCLFLWLLARREHKNARFEQTGTFQVPMLIGVLFGVYKSPALLSARGVGGQLSSFFLFLTGAGSIFGFIKSEDMRIYLTLDVLLGLLLFGLVYLISKIFGHR
jgi:hypothetical protein